MYNEYFGLSEAPFSIAPDPRYLYMSRQHREALAHLIYGIGSNGGFILLTGEIGAGKTTVCRCLLEQMPEKTNVALLLNPKLEAIELLATICDELKIPYPEGGTSIKSLVDRINEYLLEANAAGYKTVVIIDESQNLDTRVLEQLRLLTNLETNQRKLLQIIMLGQPELLQILERPDMEQLTQRITARYHLHALTRDEVAEYIRHRLGVAGLRGDVFPSSTVTLLYKLTGGVPRRINVLCDRALLGAYVQNSHSVDRKTLLKAADEVFGKGSVQGAASNYMLAWVLVALVLLVTGAGAAYFYQQSVERVAEGDHQEGKPETEKPSPQSRLPQKIMPQIQDGLMKEKALLFAGRTVGASTTVWANSEREY
jgi:general secretion pathway protein A